MKYAYDDFSIDLDVIFDPGPMSDIKVVYCTGARTKGEPGVKIFRPKDGTACLDVLFGDGSNHRIFCWFQFDGINDSKLHHVRFHFDRDDCVSAYLDGKKHPLEYDISSQRGKVPIEPLGGF